MRESDIFRQRMATACTSIFYDSPRRARVSCFYSNLSALKHDFVALNNLAPSLLRAILPRAVSRRPGRVKNHEHGEMGQRVGEEMRGKNNFNFDKIVDVTFRQYGHFTVESEIPTMDEERRLTEHEEAKRSKKKNRKSQNRRARNFHPSGCLNPRVVYLSSRCELGIYFVIRPFVCASVHPALVREL